MKKILTILLAISLMAFALPLDAQVKPIKRQQNTKTEQRKSNKKSNTKTSSASLEKQQSGWYYVCVMQSWNLANAREVCKRINNKGYSAQVIDLGYDDYYECNSYTVCVKKTKSKKEAQQFVRSFKNPTDYTDYVYYGTEFIGVYEDFLKM